jgi:threonylcarbamoyladenosine tRNA methylthiotransferase MtaB
MPHLHMSLQAGDDMVLKRMKRRHLRQDAIDMASRARDLRPDMAFGADIIAGFPTETDEMFENTRRIIEECDLVYCHIFPYSEREGTPAVKMPQVPHQLRKERAAILREQGDKQLSKFLSNQINKQHKVIVEKNNFGRSENFSPVRLSGEHEQGDLLTITADSVENNVLMARIS